MGDTEWRNKGTEARDPEKLPFLLWKLTSLPTSLTSPEQLPDSEQQFSADRL